MLLAGDRDPWKVAQMFSACTCVSFTLSGTNNESFLRVLTYSYEKMLRNIVISVARLLQTRLSSAVEEVVDMRGGSAELTQTYFYSLVR